MSRFTWVLLTLAAMNAAFLTTRPLDWIGVMNLAAAVVVLLAATMVVLL